MKPSIYLILLIWFSGCCHDDSDPYGVTVSNISDRNVYLNIYDNAQLRSQFISSKDGFTLGTIYEGCDSGKKDEHEKLVKLFADSIIFIDSASMRKIRYINPLMDNRVDINAKPEAHFWNYDYWIFSANRSIFYEIKNEHFDMYGEML